MVYWLYLRTYGLQPVSYSEYYYKRAKLRTEVRRYVGTTNIPYILS